MTQTLDLVVLAAGSFVGFLALCLWLLAVSTGRSDWPGADRAPPRRF